MKPSILFIYSLISIALLSCNNNKPTGNTTSPQDSVRRADSIRAENEARTSREQYDRHLNAQIDSLQAKLREQDSLNAKRTKNDLKRWQEQRKDLNARIGRIRQQKQGISTVSKDNWDKFKLSMDTAMNNLKSSWNRTLDKMKAK